MCIDLRFGFLRLNIIKNNPILLRSDLSKVNVGGWLVGCNAPNTGYLSL